MIESLRPNERDALLAHFGVAEALQATSHMVKFDRRSLAKMCINRLFERLYRYEPPDFGRSHRTSFDFDSQ